jgi:hypothetical protein
MNNMITYCASLFDHNAITTDVQSFEIMLDHGVHTYQELLKDNMITRPYLDADGYYETQPTVDEMDMMTRHVLEDVHDIFAPCYTNKTDVAVTLATRHRWVSSRNSVPLFKVSFRVFAQGLAIPYTDIPKLVRSRIAEKGGLHLLKEKTCNGAAHEAASLSQTLTWDMSPYKRNEQLLAAINCFKTPNVHSGERLVRHQMCLERPLRDFIVQAITGTEIMIEVPYTDNVLTVSCSTRSNKVLPSGVLSTPMFCQNEPTLL